jgi:hypothetical protein
MAGGRQLSDQSYQSLPIFSPIPLHLSFQEPIEKEFVLKFPNVGRGTLLKTFNVQYLGSFRNTHKDEYFSCGDIGS